MLITQKLDVTQNKDRLVTNSRTVVRNYLNHLTTAVTILWVSIIGWNFARTVGVKNENNSYNIKTVNMMPVVVDHDIRLNSCGGGKPLDFNLQTTCRTTKPMFLTWT